MGPDEPSAHPPAGAAALLRRALPGGQRDGVLGDLEETFHAMLSAEGARPARRWYRREALRLAAGFLGARLQDALGRWTPRLGRPARPGPARRAAGWVTDLRHALRLCVASPWLTLVASLALGAGMALSIIVFGLTWDSVFADLPFDEGDRIVALRDIDLLASDDVPIAPATVLEWRRRQQSVQELSVYVSRVLEIDDGQGGATRYRAARVTASSFDVTRVPPLMGRTLTSADAVAGAPKVVVVGHRLWRSLLGADPDVVGRGVVIDREQRRVVGVMPEGYRFPVSEDLWLPLDLETAARSGTALAGVRVFGRLANGVTAQQAAAELDAIRRQLATAGSPGTGGAGAAAGGAAGRGDPGTAGSAATGSRPGVPQETEPRVTTVVPYTHGELEPGTEPVLVGILVFMLLVLAIACASVANLLLARASARSGEIAVRAALGASRGRLVGQLFLEALVLSTAGAVVGLVVARAGLGWFDAYVQTEMTPFWIRFTVSPSAAAFAAVAALVAAAIAGIAPALRATGGAVHAVLQDRQGTASGIRFGRLSGLLTVAEVTLSVAFLAGAAASARSLMVAASDTGLPEDRVLTAAVDLVGDLGSGAAGAPDADGGGSRPASASDAEGGGSSPAGAPNADGGVPGASWNTVQDEILRALEGHSRVRAAALVTDLPGAQHRRTRIEIEGQRRDGGMAVVYRAAISPGLLETMEARLLTGRNFGRGDVPGSEPVAIVNESFARDYLGDGNPLGRRFRSAGTTPGPWLRIVGVAPDLAMTRGSRDRRAGYYTPLSQDPPGRFRVALRVDDAPMEMAAPLREIVQAVDPRIRVTDLATLADVGSQFLLVFKMMAMLLAGVGAMALLLALASLHAVMSFSVTQRTREIGIRVALGARPLEVMAVVLRRGLLQIGTGLVLGCAGGWALLRLLATFPGDFVAGGPGLLAAVAALLLATGTVACLVPSLRILGIHPVEALRRE